MDSIFNISGGDWQLALQLGSEDQSITNFRLARANGKHFHVTMVEDTAILADGSTLRFRAPLIFEHDQGKDKVGDVVIIFRQHPHTGRFMVQVEEENVFEDETTVKKIWRAERSSVDNIAQAVKKTVVHTGWTYSNPRRIGGKPIKDHYVIANWAPQLAEKMMDVFDFVQNLDAQGLASFLKALQNMPDHPARMIFNQMRTPPQNGKS